MMFRDVSRAAIPSGDALQRGLDRFWLLDGPLLTICEGKFEFILIPSIEYGRSAVGITFLQLPTVRDQETSGPAIRRPNHSLVDHSVEYSP